MASPLASLLLPLATVLGVLLVTVITQANADGMIEEKSPHASYTVHNYALEEEGYYTTRRMYMYKGAAPPFDPTKNIITVFAKEYGDEAEPGKWGFSPEPTTFLHKNWLSSGDSPVKLENSKYWYSPRVGKFVEVNPPMPRDSFLFLHFFTPALRSDEDRGAHEREFRRMIKAREEAVKKLAAKEKGKKKEEMPDVPDDNKLSSTSEQHSSSSSSRTEHMWVLHLSSAGSRQGLLDSDYKLMIRYVVDLIWKEDLAQMPEDWLEQSMVGFKERFKQRLEEWEATLYASKAAAEESKSKSMRSRLAATFPFFQSKKQNVEHLLNSGAIGKQDPLYPEVLCDVDAKTAYRIVKGEPSITPPAGGSSSKRRISGSLFGGLANKVKQQQKSRSREEEVGERHILVQQGFYAKGKFGQVFKVHIRPHGKITPNSELLKYPVEGRPGEYGPFAIKYITLSEKALKDPKALILSAVLNEAITSHAFDHPNLLRTLFVCKPAPNEIALISAFANRGDYLQLSQKTGPLIMGPTSEQEEEIHFVLGKTVLGPPSRSGIRSQRRQNG